MQQVGRKRNFDRLLDPSVFQQGLRQIRNGGGSQSKCGRVGLRVGLQLSELGKFTAQMRSLPGLVNPGSNRSRLLALSPLAPAAADS